MASSARLMDIREAFLEARTDIERALYSDLEAPAVRASWISLEGTLSPTEALERIGSVAGIDGGSALEEANLGQKVFAVSSAAAVFKAGSKPEELRVYQVGVIDFFKAEDRVRIYRETLEARIAAYVAITGRARLILLDGSIEANLIAEPVFKAVVPGRYAGLDNDEGEDILREFEKIMRGIPLHSILRVVTASPAVQKEVEEAAYRVVGEEDEGEYRKPLLAVSAMERLEQGVSITALISAAKASGITLVSVAKRSSARSHFQSMRPDIALVQRFTRGPGYTKPRIQDVPVSGYILRAASRLLGEDVEGNIVLTTLYARLADGAAPLRIELIGTPTQGEIENLLETLAGISVWGYPYPLRRAHELAKIGRADLEAGLRAIGFLPEMTGREALGE